MKIQTPEVVQLALPARYTYLHLLRECIADMLQLVEDVVELEMLIQGIQLAVHEACTNIINHAYQHKTSEIIHITLTLHFDHPRLVVELLDQGHPFHAENYTPPNLEEMQTGGYGLFLINKLMDTVTYTSQPGRNEWCLVKHVTA
ncbi:MAG: ATP-binding protein [Candidatus Viridilinea halotolerans]|uniref:ATP-binding protein n=1 Tax=Candidatus Viridilinea halotolerans TaxID=2491704 RepID=A0A426TR82_9CHLR|nr:MAG: ATP-binding protein [Candidatus Viridilinea halotolerans]